jgi:hypothetical protein
LEGWPLSPFLNTGATRAVFQSEGILLWLVDAWNINVSAGVISLAVSFSRRAGILSGPVALCVVYSRSGINHMWIFKNSKDLLDNLKSRSFSQVSSIKTFDFSMWYY